jgi:hypothetical protein
MKQLLGEKEIDVELMGKTMEVLYNSTGYSKFLIDYILRDRKNLFIKFSNLQNLQHFANILNTISLSLDNIYHENYDLNFAIIYIAERSYYKNEKTSEKIYLCALLSKNKLYSTRSFWMDLIELKLHRRVEEHLNKFDSKIN